MADDSEITIGELSRTITRLDARLTAQFQEVNRRLDGLHFVPREIYTVQMEILGRRLDTLEEAKRWTTRTFVAAFLFPVLVAMLVAFLVA